MLQFGMPTIDPNLFGKWAAPAVVFMWLVQQVISFLKNRTKIIAEADAHARLEADADNYSPSAQWKEYCKNEFAKAERQNELTAQKLDRLTDDVRDVKDDQNFMKIQIKNLESKPRGHKNAH